MDSDGNLIPLVEDDQGEGIKDFVEDMDELTRLLKEQLDGTSGPAKVELDRMAELMQKGDA